MHKMYQNIHDKNGPFVNKLRTTWQEVVKYNFLPKSTKYDTNETTEYRVCKLCKWIILNDILEIDDLLACNKIDWLLCVIK